MEIATKYSVRELEMISDIFKSIAFPVRLHILELLGIYQRMSVAELITHLDIEASLLSHHLAKMKNSGVLVSSREGRSIFYEIRLKKITSIFNCIDECDIFKSE